MAISAIGLGTSLDVNSLITQLMQAESKPLQLLATKEASYQAKLSAMGSVKGALASLQTSMASLSATTQFRAMSATLADSSVATVSTGTAAQAGTYSIEVQVLAQAQKLKSTTFQASSDSVGSGTLTIDFGTYAGGDFTLNPDQAGKTISIAPGGDSLSAVRDAINAADAGVTASIVNDGTGWRLLISSSNTGVANALRITVNDDDGNDTDASGLSRLAYDASTGGVTRLTQTVAAQDATLVVDGMSISSSSNTVSDAIEGITLTLVKTNLGSPTTLRVARNTASTQAAAQSFIQAWNGAAKTLRDLGAYDAATKKGAVLQGDSTLRSIQNRLHALVNQPISPASGGLTRLSDIGIGFAADGLLSLDSAKLATVMADPNKDIATLFSSIGKPSDSLVSFSAAGSTAATGSHAISVSRLATQGTLAGGSAAGLTISAGVNDVLGLELDGAAAMVTVSPGTYTAVALAAELQSKINGASTVSDQGSSVSVTQSGGILTLTSDAYGSESTIAVTGGTAAAGLFGTPVQTDGLDVAGTIGGLTGTGSGQSLTASGFTVRVSGGATGDRGQLVYSRGYATQLDDLIDALLASDGTIAGRTDGLNSSIENIGQRREALNRRLAQDEARYRAQFTALDTLISSMNSTASFLTTQLANLPGSYNPNK